MRNTIPAVLLLVMSASVAIAQKDKAELRPSNPELELARDDLELLEAQLLVKQAILKGAEQKVQSAESLLKTIEGAGGISILEVKRYRADADNSRIEVSIRSAEVKEVQAKLAIAKRRLERTTTDLKPLVDVREERLAKLEKAFTERTAAEKHMMETLIAHLESGKKGELEQKRLELETQARMMKEAKQVELQREYQKLTMEYEATKQRLASLDLMKKQLEAELEKFKSLRDK